MAVVNTQDLEKHFESLRAWSQRDSFGADDWKNYMTVAKTVQETDPSIVESALNQFVEAAMHEPFAGYTSESKPFLLMRVVFDLPEVAPQQSRFSFKGWTNWPQADAQGNVSLAWPISFRDGKPELVAPYEGSEGKPYEAAAEYRYLRDHFPYRRLEDLGVKR
jgi:hypothetical protein